MNLDCVYQPNTSRITYEVIEGEVIIVDFDSGAYYSINALGSVIFNWVVQGMRLGEIICTLENHYIQTDHNIVQAVNEFLQALLDDGIIVRNAGTSAHIVEGASEMLGEDLLETIQFTDPVLEKYTDMEELLLLDPIHEVDEEGWPFTAENESTIPT